MTEHGFTPTRDDPASWAGREKAHIDEIDALKARVKELESDALPQADALQHYSTRTNRAEARVAELEEAATFPTRLAAWKTRHVPVIEAVQEQSRLLARFGDDSMYRNACLATVAAARKAGLGRSE